ncbi:MAG: MBL fold metallo-hydrolase [Opitutaceae bacterium]|nr:MBL fold metallo-hydrolase [Opitutaceae bacterium]
MPSLPLEDNFHDLVSKAQRGLHITDQELIDRAEITPEDLAAIKAGEARLGVLRRIARHLKLSPDALEVLAKKEAYPRAPIFPRGFAMFNTPHEDMTVNNYLVWDEKTREAAVIDTGADVAELLDLVAAKRLRVKSIFLTHAHEDHVAALPALVEATRADVWIHEREPFEFPKLRRFTDNDYFHLGVVAIKALPTWGHSPGQTTFYVQGLSWPLALCGDALFSASVGGSPTHYADQVKNTRARLFSLPKDTVFGPGHGPLTTLAHERVYNPVFAPERFQSARPAALPAEGAAAAPARPVPLPKRPKAGKAGRVGEHAPRSGGAARPAKSAKPGKDGRVSFKSRRKRSA